MSLPNFIKTYDNYKEFMIWDYSTNVDDGYGGHTDGYTAGSFFMGALVLNNSINTQLAQKQGVTGVYTLTVEKSQRMPWHTVFQAVTRDETGKITEYGNSYRVTSKDDSVPPRIASLDMRQVNVEEFEMPKS